MATIWETIENLDHALAAKGAENDQLLDRIRALEAGLALLADPENWIQDEYADFHWAYWEEDGSDTWPQEIARAALAGEAGSDHQRPLPDVRRGVGPRRRIRELETGLAEYATEDNWCMAFCDGDMIPDTWEWVGETKPWLKARSVLARES